MEQKHKYCRYLKSINTQNNHLGYVLELSLLKDDDAEVRD